MGISAPLPNPASLDHSVAEVVHYATRSQGVITPGIQKAFEALSHVDRRIALSEMPQNARDVILGNTSALEHDKYLSSNPLKADVHVSGDDDPAFQFDYATLEPGVNGWSSAHARGTSISSQRVYEAIPDNSVGRVFTKADLATEANLDGVADLLRDGFDVEFINGGGSTQGFVASNPETGYTQICVRGTEPGEVKDLKADADVLCMKSTPYGELAEGIDHALDEVWPQMQAALSRARAKFGDDLSVTCTGHSLGAAVASCAAQRIDDMKGMQVDSVYTYESPKYRSPEAADVYNGSRLGAITFRVRVDKDMVARAPRSDTGDGYAHVGIPIHCDEAGRMIPGYEPEPNMFSLSAIGKFFTGLNPYTWEAKKVRDGQPEILSDHGMHAVVHHMYINQNTPVVLTEAGARMVDDMVSRCKETSDLRASDHLARTTMLILNHFDDAALSAVLTNTKSNFVDTLMHYLPYAEQEANPDLIDRLTTWSKTRDAD